MTYRLDRAIQDHSWRQDADTKIAADPAPTWAEIKADCVGPDLPTKSDRMSPGHLDGVFFAHPFPGAADLRLTTDGLHFTVGDITLRYNGEAFHAPRYRVESTLPHPAAINAAGVHAEIHRVLAVVMGARVPDTASTDHLQDRLTDEMDRRRDAEQALAKITDAHAVVSQRLAGSQKEVAERDATIESNEAKVIDLTLRLGETQNRVADLESELAGVRAAIAVAVGLDGSASLALILDTVKSADTTKDTDLARLVSYHQAPVKFADRPLTLAERASFVIRRLWQGRTNAANEAASLRRELGDIEAALGDLPDTAEREPIGDREEHLGLSAAERIRLSR